MRLERAKLESSPDHDPFRLTISELKFKPNIKTLSIPKVKQNPEQETPVIAQQIPRRGLSFRSDR